VKAYVNRNKNDAADAEAICESIRRPTMRFVRAKSAEQQGRLMLHRARDLLMRQRTQAMNALRAHLAELGITAAQETAGLKELLKTVTADVTVVTLCVTVSTGIIAIPVTVTAVSRSTSASARLRSR
jgi:transposase